ncbi:hypothetical protein [Streptomyces sp. NPDC058612]|uniref:hypothetical protein n=1 Tax=Streptomyces sp. NPDC058612 TaxID=3346555 RepID=UPI0036651A95
MTALLVLALLCLAVHLARYRVDRRLERIPPQRLAPVALPEGVRPAYSGPGRHRRDGEASVWLACHNVTCAHLETPHTPTPPGLVCSWCGSITPNDPTDEEASQ